MAERPAERFRCFLELGIMVALRLDVIAHPGLGRDQRARIGAPLFARRTALHIANRGVKPRDPFRDCRRIVGQLDQLVTADPKVGEHRVRKDFAELRRAAAAFTALGREALHIFAHAFGEGQRRQSR